MIRGISSSISALMAFGKRMGVIANNVANLQSEGFKKSRVILKEREHGGVSADVEKIETAGDRILEEVEGAMVEKELSNVDMEEDLASALLTQTNYKANLKMIETEDEMLGTLLNTKG